MWLSGVLPSWLKSGRRRKVKSRASRTRWLKQPRNREIINKLIELYSNVDESEKSEAIVKKGTNDLADDPAMLRIAITYYGVKDKWQEAETPALQLVRIEPTNAQNFLLLARVFTTR